MCENSSQTTVQNVVTINNKKSEKREKQRQQNKVKPQIENSSLWINSSESDPMGSRFRISSTDFLDEISERSVCDKCLKSRKYYCYSCHQPLDTIRGRVPKVRLPVKVDIIKHIQEVDGKSTSSHAVIIAPEDCFIHTFPDIPDWTHERVRLVFPGPNAQTVNQIVDEFYSEDNRHKTNDNSRNILPFDRVVFIDSTWRQTKQILSDPRVSPLKERSVVLSTHESLFWRHQRNTPRTYLSTIEAIYYFFVDLEKSLDTKLNNKEENSGEYDRKYDNLLFFFKHTYNRLRLKYNI